MDTAIIISIILLVFFAYAIFQYTRDSETEVTDLTEKDETYLLSELASIKFWVWITAIAGFMFTAGYALNFMSGSSIAYIHNWGASEWIGALSGLLAALVITGAQKSIYTSYSTGKAGLIGTGLIITFVVFSEVSAPIEREELKVKEISQNSQTYQAVVGAIKGGSTASPSAYSNQLATAQAEKAKHVFELGRCDRHKEKGVKRVQRCETYEKREIAKYQAQIDSYQASMKTETESNQSTSLALVDKAKDLENNADNHSGIIKVMMDVLGASSKSVMLLASLLFITAFEIAFHYLGTRQAVLTEALTRMGNIDISYDEEYKRMKKAEKFRAKTDGLKATRKTTQDTDSPTVSINRLVEKMKPSNVGFTPATAFTSNQHTGTHEKQYDMFPAKKQEKAPNSNHSPTVTKQAPLDLVEQVKPNLVEQVKTGGEKDQVKKVLHDDDFNPLYVYISKQVRTGKLKPSIPAVRKEVHHYVKQKANIKSSSVSLPECTYLTMQIRNKMLNDGIIRENPNYRNGLAKYLVA